MSQSEFEELWQKHFKPLRAAAKSALPDNTDAVPDAVQEAFTLLWEKGYQKNPVGALYSYLLTALRRHIRTTSTEKRFKSFMDLEAEAGSSENSSPAAFPAGLMTGADSDAAQLPEFDHVATLGFIVDALRRKWSEERMADLKTLLLAQSWAQGLECVTGKRRALKPSAMSNRLAQAYWIVIKCTVGARRGRASDESPGSMTPVGILHALLVKHSPGWNGPRPNGLSEYFQLIQRLPEQEKKAVLETAYSGLE